MKKAFTIAEAMVSMVVILVGTAIALSVSYFCSANTERVYAQMQAYSTAYDVVNCYKQARSDYEDNLSSQQTRFAYYLRWYCNSSVAVTTDSDNSDTQNYEFSTDKLTVKATVDYGNAVVTTVFYLASSTVPIYSFAYDVANNTEIAT